MAVAVGIQALTVIVSLCSSKIREDQLVIDALANQDVSSLQFHQKCLDSYIHPKTLEKFEKDKASMKSMENDPDSDDDAGPPKQRRKSDRRKDNTSELKNNELATLEEETFAGRKFRGCGF